jgi:hypothetical protein
VDEPQHFHDEQRIALRSIEEGIHVSDAFRRGPTRDLVTPEAAKREVATFARDLCERVACLRREARFDVAVRGDDDDTRGVNLASDEMQEQEGADIGDVNVVEEDHDRALSCHQ